VQLKREAFLKKENKEKNRLSLQTMYHLDRNKYEIKTFSDREVSVWQNCEMWDDGLIILTIAAATAECCTELSVIMGQIKNTLRKVCGLDNAANFDCPVFGNQFSYGVEDRRRELRYQLSVPASSGCENEPRNTTYIAKQLIE